MTRTKFRKLWLFSISIMIIVAMYFHGEYKETEKLINRKTKQVERLTIERRSGRQLTSALADLNSRTIDESTSTRLDILRYLGLEESRLEVNISPAVEKKISRTKMATRRITVTGNLPYTEALNQLDYFYNTKKISINYITVTPAGRYGDMVNFNLGGTIYGLKKAKK